MVSIRVEIRNGVLVPLDDISALQPGQKAEIEVVAQPAPSDLLAELAALRGSRKVAPPTVDEVAAVQAQVAQSAGVYSDDPMTLEEIYAFQQQLREKQAELEQQRWSNHPTS